MRPVINDTEFGSITVDGKIYEHDVFITLKGEVKKRKKKLSKAVYGTSHTISRDEIKHVYEQQADGIIIGSGQQGVARLSDEASGFLKNKKCEAITLPTPEAIREYNKAKGKWLGLFHTTC